MGWWKVRDIKTGQVDFSHKCPTNQQFVNAVPGEETEDILYNGDGPADLMGLVLRKINVQYEDAWKRPAKKEELTAVFNFCCNGIFKHRKGEGS
jgi:hypothetical protein